MTDFIKMHYCSFCRKRSDELDILIQSINPMFIVNICDECVRTCVKVIEEKHAERKRKKDNEK